MAEREEEQGWEAGEAERADEEFLAAIAEWSGTPSSNKILLTMLASTRLRSMSNVIPKDQTAGPVHGWSICTLVQQAETTVSDRETGAIRKVSISSLTASTLPSRTSVQNDKAFHDAKQEMSIDKSRWHRASKSMCPGPVFQNVSSRNDTTRLLYQPVREKYPLLKDRPNRSYIHQKFQEAQLHGIVSFAPAVCASTPQLPHQKEATTFTHKTISTVNGDPLRLEEIRPGGAHEVIQIEHLMPVTDIRRIFESPLTSASWLANDILFLCATRGQALHGTLLSVIEVRFLALVCVRVCLRVCLRVRACVCVCVRA